MVNTSKVKSNSILLLAVLILAIFFLPYLLQGNESYINPIDNLDSNHVWYKVIVDQKAHFLSNDHLVDGMIGLQPRHVYPSEFDPILWIYTVFSPYWGYVVNFMLVHLIAFFTMYILLKKHVITRGGSNVDSEIFASGGALIFALIPFWVHGGISAAGLPLMVLSVIRLEKGELKEGFLFSIIYVLYSSLILSGIFILITYASYLILGTFIKKIRLSAPKRHIVNMSLITLVYIVTNYRLFQSVLFSDFESQRLQTNTFGIGSIRLSDLFEFPFQAFLIKGQWHAGAMFGLISVGALILLIVALLKAKKNILLGHLTKAMLTLLVLLFMFSNGLSTQLISSIPILGALQWERFYFLLPFGLSLTFVGLFYWLVPSLRCKRLIFSFCVLGAAAFYFIKDFNWNNSLKLILGKPTHGVTYAEFYKLESYPIVKERLEADGYDRVVSLGKDPAIAVYHNIRSADGYLANYQLASKVKMRRIIAGELEKSEELETYFDSWGSRCYFFNSGFTKNLKPINDTITSFDYDFEELNEGTASHIIHELPVSESILNGYTELRFVRVN